MESKRIAWLDFAKLVTMFLVIFDHLGLRNHDVSDWVWLFHLPTFFFISGVFYKQPNSFFTGIKKDAMRLLLPVLIWWIIGMLTWQVFFLYYFQKETFWSSYTQSIVDFFSGYHMTFGWFMVALFVMKIEMFYIVKMKRWLGIAVAMVVMPLIALFLKNYIGELLPYYLTNSLAAFPFFYIGYLLSNEIKGLSWSKGTSVVTMIALLSITIIILPFVGHVSLNAVEYGNGIVWMYVAGFIGCMMVIFFSYALESISKYKMIKVLGGGTVVLLLFQPPFLYLFKILYKHLFYIQISGAYFDTFSAAIATLLIMLIMYPCILWINKYMPILNGLIWKTK